MNDSNKQNNNQKSQSFFSRFLYILKTIFFNIFKVINKTISAVKFIFTIPLLSFAASVFVLIFSLIFKPFINLLPDALNIGFIETFMAAVIFISLRFFIYRDKLYYDKEFNHYKSLSGFVFSIIFWVFPILLFKREGIYVEAFLEEGLSYTPFSFIYVAFYLPHMWLGTIFSEFFYVVMGTLVINSAIAAVATSLLTKNFIGVETK